MASPSPAAWWATTSPAWGWPGARSRSASSPRSSPSSGTPRSRPRPCAGDADHRRRGPTMDATLFRAWIAEAAWLVVDNADHLTHLDAAIGDADHGINLNRGFQAALLMLAETAPTTPGAVLATVGRALISKTGGASGSLYGAGFRAAAKTLGEDPDVSPVQLGAALEAALSEIRQLGAAAEGDKTMVDALIPAVSAYRWVIDAGADLPEATRAAADAAARGLQATIGLPARKGRARHLGPRTVGQEGPGAAANGPILR